MEYPGDYSDANSDALMMIFMRIVMIMVLMMIKMIYVKKNVIAINILFKQSINIFMTVPSIFHFK